MDYQTLTQLKQYKTQLLDTVRLNSGVQLASWQNQQDCVSVCGNHHTLSLYTAGGYENYKKTTTGWKKGGAPHRFCLMPENATSTWDIRGQLSFTHLYYTDAHLRQVATQIWDKEPSLIELDEQDFVDDPQIDLIYQHFLLKHNWHLTEHHLQFSTASTLLLNHVLQHYSNVHWRPPVVKGGLSPHMLKHILQWIDAHLSEPLTLACLAQQTHLSEYHFAHMFKHSMNIAPHTYVMQQRLKKAHDYLSHSQISLTDIAILCGFSSAAHLSQRFKKDFGYLPSVLRKNCVQNTR